MVSSDKHLANLVGGKTTRPCDHCMRKRARWYCVADDAFLCQSCDALVHAANPLARRHERLHLKTTLKLSTLDKPASLSWHQGFTKKPRTPRAGNHHKHVSAGQTTKSEESSMSLSISFNKTPVHLVPEIGTDETTTTLSGEDQLLYQVPVLDPFADKLSTSGKLNESVTDNHGLDSNSLNGLILPSEVELAEFAANIENLLGKGFDDNEAFSIDKLGFLDCRTKDSSQGLEKVKVEEDEMRYDIGESEMEQFELSFDYDWEEKEAVEGGGGGFREVVKEDEDEDEDDEVDVGMGNYGCGNDKKKSRILKLDFEGIIAAWDEERSPWTTGDRPEFDSDDCWLECMGGCGIMHHPHHLYGDMGIMTANPAMLDGGREARVSRYREKRRTRLFSKKIRYEVRKLNAEKRPRMKGRFVKRASSLDFPLLSK